MTQTPTTDQPAKLDRMCFKLDEPCADCPFDPTNPGFLGRRRAQEIAESVGKRGESFMCHKTLVYGGPDGPQQTRRSQHCYAAMLVLQAAGIPNQAMQVAERMHKIHPSLSPWTPADLHMELPHFPTLEAFVDHHSFGETDEDAD